MLTIYIDFKCPASYLALQPTQALLRRLGRRARWAPFRSAERETPSVGSSAEVIESHRRVREASRRALFEKYAALRGIELRFPEKPIATDLALGALGEMQGERESYVEAAFEAFWRDNVDLDDTGVVTALIKQSGAPHRGDLSTARETAAAVQKDAEALGVFDTPFYVVGDQVFYGRENLPWIEEILSAQE